MGKGLVAVACGTMLLAQAAYTKKPGESIIRKALGVKDVITIDNSVTVEERCNEIRAKVAEIFHNLGIENLQEKPAEIQKQAAYKLLKYVLQNSKFVDDYENEQSHDQDIDLIYMLLCQNYSVNSLNSEVVTLNYLYQKCGIDSKEATIKYQFGKTQKERNVLILNFQDQKSQDEYICDPNLAHTYDGYWKNNTSFGSLFMPTQTYLEKHARLEKDKYTITEKPAPKIDNTQLKPSVDLGPEIGL